VASTDTTPYPNNTVNEPFTVPEWFWSIERGMTYDEVVGIIGDDGRLQGRDPSDPPGRESYMWNAGRGWVLVDFDDGLVTWSGVVGGP
jgi:hypothetical protein